MTGSHPEGAVPERRGLEFGPGRRAVLHYRVVLPDGTELDSTRGGEPLALRAGDGSLAPGVEVRLHGLRGGDRARIYLAPGEAFGGPEPEAVQDLPRSEFPAGMALAPGLLIGFSAPSGIEVTGRIVELGQDRVRVDFNHPLAGRAFVLEVEVLSVEAG